MKTLSINPFNLRPQIKNMFRKPKHVEIPDYIYSHGNEKLYDKLIGLQNNLDYIATKFGADISFMWTEEPPIPYIVYCKTKAGDGLSENFSEDDSPTEVSHKIYAAVSKSLIEDDKKLNQTSLDVQINPYYVELVNRFEEYRGILDFYTKKYKGISFKVKEYMFTEVAINCTKGLDTVTDFIDLKKDDEEHKSIQYKKIHNLVKQVMELYNEQTQD